MPRGLQRLHESRQSHLVTFSCYHRQANFDSPEVYDLFLPGLEQMRQRFAMCIYGYVVMPEHVHLLVSEPGAPSNISGLRRTASHSISSPRQEHSRLAEPAW